MRMKILSVRSLRPGEQGSGVKETESSFDGSCRLSAGRMDSEGIGRREAPETHGAAAACVKQETPEAGQDHEVCTTAGHLRRFQTKDKSLKHVRACTPEQSHTTMAALSTQALSGRKRRGDLWKYFIYKPAENTTECLVGDEGTRCGHKLCGKNTTNLKRHLKTHHAAIFVTIPETTHTKTKPAGPLNRAHSPIPAAFAAGSKYRSDSQEQHAKEQAMALWIGRTGLPACTVEDEDFILMIEAFDKRLTIPKRTTINNLIDKFYNDEKQKFKARLARARKITIGLDIWTKKGLTASFLAISACYFCIEKNKAEQILLRLDQIAHPHTEECIETCIERCTEDWGIPQDKILTVITDNGSSMVAALKTSEQVEPSSSEDEEDESMESDNEDYELVGEDQRFGVIGRTPCVVHTLQLVVNMIHKEASVKQLLDKSRVLVKLFRESSVATEWLLQLCQLTLVKDCPTRWSSTYLMITRLLQVKDSVVQVADGMSWDYSMDLLPNEWQMLTALRDLLLPFAEHTQMLQSDTQSLSLVVPALLDLRGHLSDFPHAQGSSYKDLASLAKKMDANMEQRFSCFLDHTDSKFSPLAAAACLLDPTVAPEALLENDDEQVQELQSKAEDYIAQLVPRVMKVEAEDEEPEEGEETKGEPQRKRHRFRFLSKVDRPSRLSLSKPCVRREMLKFKEQLLRLIKEEGSPEVALDFWVAQGDSVYPSLKPIALDLLAMPASQAFAERAFSVTGDLSHGRRNRVILERSAFLKLNR